jgi:hypothetical protein
MATAAQSEPLLGILQPPNEGAILARFDPLSLEPVSRQVPVGEYHNAWSASPDGSHLALGVSAPGRTGRVGVLIVDLKAMKVVRRIETGIAAEALGWLAPRRLVAGLQRGGTVLVDPLTGRILRRWPGFSFPDTSARSRDGLVMLFPGTLHHTGQREGSAAPRLAVVDAQGRLRSVALEDIQLGVRFVEGVTYADDAGLAVDPGRARAYVFAADAPVAEVALRTMGVSYHRLESLFLKPGELGDKEVRPEDVGARNRRALWLEAGRALVFGRDFVPARGEASTTIAAPATLVDTGSWSSCTLDTSAGGAAFVADRLLAYGSGDPSSLGLRAYSGDGRRVFHLFKGEQVRDVLAGAGRAYVSTARALHVVDVRSGKIVGEIVPPPELVEVVAGPS